MPLDDSVMVSPGVLQLVCKLVDGSGMCGVNAGAVCAMT